MKRLLTLLALVNGPLAWAQIPKPTDAPAPLPPAETAKRATLAPGFKMELIAAEPLVREPSGMCWDERGRLFVCELHGYNYEGQLDIDELNKTGKLDHEVRRIPANDKAVADAKKEQYGTVKMLVSSKSDGNYDKSVVVADRLPPCYGLVPARGGLIVMCAPDIVYLADKDGDGVWETREVLYTGFTDGILERRASGPIWGPDNWIYVGRGTTNRPITGPHLKAPVILPNTDFRIRADGTAIEPVTGHTGTIGVAATAYGERFGINTATPTLAPTLDWRYLARNPFAAASLNDINLQADTRCYPTSEAHPWRKKRFEDPGFSAYYTKRYGKKESQANGFFTSLCSPMVYRDTALPGIAGQLFACEPAQNLITRGTLGRVDGLPTFTRLPGEESREFLATTDIWFHPIALTHAPDGSIVVADYYREIIEDYSAIPRYLQQIYGFMNGKDHGRVWRVTHADIAPSPSADMSLLTAEQLAGELIGPRFWRRETARRLLLEKQDKSAVPTILALKPTDVEGLLNVAFTLDGLGELKPDVVKPLLAHANPGVRVQALRLAEPWLNLSLTDAVLALGADRDAGVLLQLAMTLGDCRDPRALPLLARLARERGKQKWMANAVLSALAGRSGAMLVELIREPAKLGDAADLIDALAAGVGARRDPKELSAAIVAIEKLDDKNLKMTCLSGLKQRLKATAPMSLTDDAADAITRLANDPRPDVKAKGEFIRIALKLESMSQRAERLAKATATLNDIQAAANSRVAAVAQLAFERDPAVTASLLAAIPSSTPAVRDAILVALLSQREAHAALIESIESNKLARSTLSAIQRASLLGSPEPNIAARAKALFASLTGVDDATFKRYTAALAGKRDIAHGEAVFRARCAQCHQAHGLGIAVGPNLSAEFQRAEETIIKDVLAPSDVISPGFMTYSIETVSGEVFNGVLAVESASSVTLRAAEGKDQVILRKDIERIKTLATSIMPDDLTKTASPQDVADVIAWLRNPPAKVMLLDENPAIVSSFNDGNGTAKFITTDRFTGAMCLEVTPPQRACPKIPGWSYHIRENPGPGEFRYLRFAWKSVSGDGVLIELAADSHWPAAKSPVNRYYSGTNTTGWAARKVSDQPPREWTVVTVDLWKDGGNFKLTGFAPTAMGGPARFDSFELLQANDKPVSAR